MPKRPRHKWTLDQKLRAMNRRKPRPPFQLEAELVIGLAMKVATLAEKARVQDVRQTWFAYFDALDHYRFMKNEWLGRHCKDYVPDLVKHPEKYAPKTEDVDGSASPNEQDYAEEE